MYIGEDTLSVRIADPARRAAVVAALRKDDFWTELVPGLADVTVRFDPAVIALRLAVDAFANAVAAPACTEQADMSAIVLPALFDADNAPDAALVADSIGIAPDALPEWITARSYRVAMMGFQPGFAYLEDTGEDDLPDISRLAIPRQNVAAGSIGMLGRRACIYALGGPGGWPIVGRVTRPVFEPLNSAQPFVLHSSMSVKFTAHMRANND